MDIQYCRCDDGAFVPTDERPAPPEEDARLRRELGRHYADGLVHLHSPGDGWHFLPGADVIAYNGETWFATHPTTSARAILTHALDICAAANLAFNALWQEAYPQSPVPQITDQDRQHCTRPATLHDLSAVLSDLESVNFHQLHKVLKEAIQRRGT